MTVPTALIDQMSNTHKTLKEASCVLGLHNPGTRSLHCSAVRYKELLSMFYVY